MQMVINLAPVSLSNKKVNFYTCPRLTFLKKNATENAYKSISEPLDFKIFWGGMPPDPTSGSKLASSCSEVWLRPWPSSPGILELLADISKIVPIIWKPSQIVILWFIQNNFNYKNMLTFISKNSSSLHLPVPWQIQDVNRIFNSADILQIANFSSCHVCGQ